MLTSFQKGFEEFKKRRNLEEELEKSNTKNKSLEEELEKSNTKNESLEEKNEEKNNASLVFLQSLIELDPIDKNIKDAIGERILQLQHSRPPSEQSPPPKKIQKISNDTRSEQPLPPKKIQKTEANPAPSEKTEANTLPSVSSVTRFFSNSKSKTKSAEAPKATEAVQKPNNKNKGSSP